MDIDDTHGSRGRGETILIPLYQFQLLINIKAFAFMLLESLNRIFNGSACNYHCTKNEEILNGKLHFLYSVPDFYSMRFVLF